MANILTSSIGKKLIMSISGLFLILFLLLHMTINLFSVIDSFTGSYGAADGLFQAGCDFMALPIVTIMVPVLALGFVIHIIYAFYLTICNIKSRGGYSRYEVSSKAKTESWASKNMLALGIIVLGILAFLLNATFGQWWVVVIYIIWFGALWFHLTHGFWSAFQTVGWSNQIWVKRLNVIGYIFATIIFLGFAVVAINACLQANGLLCCGCC